MARENRSEWNESPDWVSGSFLLLLGLFFLGIVVSLVLHNRDFETWLDLSAGLFVGLLLGTFAVGFVGGAFLLFFPTQEPWLRICPACGAMRTRDGCGDCGYQMERSWVELPSNTSHSKFMHGLFISLGFALVLGGGGIGSMPLSEPLPIPWFAFLWCIPLGFLLIAVGAAFVFGSILVLREPKRPYVLVFRDYSLTDSEQIDVGARTEIKAKRQSSLHSSGIATFRRDRLQTLSSGAPTDFDRFLACAIILGWFEALEERMIDWARLGDERISCERSARVSVFRNANFDEKRLPPSWQEASLLIVPAIATLTKLRGGNAFVPIDALRETLHSLHIQWMALVKEALAEERMPLMEMIASSLASQRSFQTFGDDWFFGERLASSKRFMVETSSGEDSLTDIVVFKKMKNERSYGHLSERA